MIGSKRNLWIALLIPIVGLALLTIYKAAVLKVGAEYTLPIRGYDPRDLLSGHYLIYGVEYGVADVCANSNVVPGDPPREGFVCLEPKMFSFEKPASCEAMVRGVCSGNRFVAGIEKFFIPEGRARELERAVIEQRGSIKISILGNGQAQVKELLVDGKPWR